MNLRALACAIAAVLVATVGTFVVYDWIAPSISLLFFLAIVASAMYGGYHAGFLASALSTISLAYYFVPPRNGFDFGVDDAARLAAFMAVSFATAWLAAARRRAEEAQRQSVEELRAAFDTLRRINEWPAIGGPDLAASIRQVLQHAADVLRAANAVAVWETDEEPWLYVSRTSAPSHALAKLPPESAEALLAPSLHGSTFVTAAGSANAGVILKQGTMLSEWQGVALNSTLTTAAPELCGLVMSAAFRGELVHGRLFLVGVPDAGSRTIPLAELLARELSSSLDQLYLADRTRGLAVREDRLRVSRDLHDGVLQALTGIRLQLQALSDEMNSDAAILERLAALERALAMEQRELRLFIDELKPAGAAVRSASSLAGRIEAMCSRLTLEWRVPIAVRVAPPDSSLPQTMEEPLRLMIHEAVVNALKHGCPTRITIAIVHSARDLQVTVNDDGLGFRFRGTLDHDSLARENVGPVTLRERVATLGGRLSVHSSPSGSRVEFSIPIPAASH